MKDAQAYQYIIEELKELRNYLSSFSFELSAMDISAANYYVARVVYPAYHDQVLLQAYRDEYFTYKNIIAGLDEEIEFFYIGVQHINQQQDNENERTTHQGWTWNIP